ncbi:MAG: STAS/SEC14 domain-containing protein [Methylococcales bacterium]|nr:STAS/SEC14 domain-containing protein [Methylococcales bacterium]
MAWTTKLNNNIIELAFIGTVSATELKEALLASNTLSKDNNTLLILADCSTMLGGHTLADLYYIISLFESLDLRKMKEALVLPNLDSSKEQVKFYETACLNRGFDVKIFPDTDTALAWLKS